jgi:hypothetical protein
MKTANAKTLGALAFARGIACVPCLDADFMSTISGRKAGDSRTIADMKAWHLGWVAASLAANA